MTSHLQVLLLSGALVLASLPANADVLLDDHFDDNALDTSIWFNDPDGSFALSGSIITVTPVSDYGCYLQAQNSGYKYSRARFEDVRVHATSVMIDNELHDDFGFSFGYVGAISGALSLGVSADGDLGLSAFYLETTPPYATWNLGTFDNGATYEIFWSAGYLAVSEDDNVIFTETDPSKIPTYPYMGFGAYIHDGVVSFDRITMMHIPEPATLTLAATASLALVGWVRRRRRP